MELILLFSSKDNHLEAISTSSLLFIFNINFAWILASSFQTLLSASFLKDCEIRKSLIHTDAHFESKLFKIFPTCITSSLSSEVKSESNSFITIIFSFIGF